MISIAHSVGEEASRCASGRRGHLRVLGRRRINRSRRMARNDPPAPEVLAIQLTCSSSNSCGPDADQYALLRGFQADMVDQIPTDYRYAVTTDEGASRAANVVRDQRRRGRSGVWALSRWRSLSTDNESRRSWTQMARAQPRRIPIRCRARSRVTSASPIPRTMLEQGAGQFQVEAVVRRRRRADHDRSGSPVDLRALRRIFARLPGARAARSARSELQGHRQDQGQQFVRIAADDHRDGARTAGATMAGTSVQIDTRPLVDGDSAPVKTIQTDKNGEFSYRLPRGHVARDPVICRDDRRLRLRRHAPRHRRGAREAERRIASRRETSGRSSSPGPFPARRMTRAHA